MTEDRKKIWAKSQLRDHGRERHRRERAEGVKNTRNMADRYCGKSGRINREAVQHPEDYEGDTV